jgi:predicted nucleotidyltransferase
LPSRPPITGRGPATDASFPARGPATGTVCVVTDLGEALSRLVAAATSGELRTACERHGVELLVAFGSAVRRDGRAQDLDIAVRLDPAETDVLALLDDLSTISLTSRIDLMNLAAAGPVARERALVGGLVLFERSPGTFARAQIAAMMERMDTDWLRRLDLDLMAR